jgi:hypothetical protein
MNVSFIKVLGITLVIYFSSFIIHGLVLKLMSLGWILGQMAGLLIVVGVVWLIWSCLK